MLKNLFKRIIIFILTIEARLVLKKYKPKIVAITGSVGKTTTKDAITAVLEKKFFVRGSQKSFNSEFGVPLTILGRDSGWNSPWQWFKVLIEGVWLILFKNHYPKILVLEVGFDRPGEIRRITDWLKPNVAVVTRIGEVPVHVEFFDSREQLIAEKSLVVSELQKDGIAILNADDPDVFAMAQNAGRSKIISFGYSNSAMVQSSQPEIVYTKKGFPKGVSSKVEYGGNSLPLSVHGSTNTATLSSALAALSVAVALDVNLVDATEALASTTPTPGRSRILEGVNESIIIDDTYNASPTAVEAALESLGAVNVSGRKIAVLGDMLELGKASAKEHSKMGIQAATVADILVTVGVRAELAGDIAEDKGGLVHDKSLYHFTASSEAGEFLKEFVKSGDVILLKGSQRIRMEKAVERLLKHPKQKYKLLVRQEKIWQQKS